MQAAEMVDVSRTLASNYLLWNKLDSQTVGLITVLVISGSVFFLALSKHRSLAMRNYERRTKTIPLEKEDWHSAFQTTEEGRLQYNSIELEAVGYGRERKSPSNEFDSDFREHTIPEDSYFTGCKKSSAVKKVRFAADVIEPCGDNKEYRRRVKALVYETLVDKRKKEAGKETKDDKSDVNIIGDSHLVNVGSSKLPANRVALYTSMHW